MTHVSETGEMIHTMDKHQNAILTVVERNADCVLMEKLGIGKQALPSAIAMIAWRLPLTYKGKELKTITTGNSSEFAEHE